jgi:hypothetical protein
VITPSLEKTNLPRTPCKTRLPRETPMLKTSA